MELVCVWRMEESVFSVFNEIPIVRGGTEGGVEGSE